MIEVRNTDSEKEFSYVLIEYDNGRMSIACACSGLTKQEAVMGCFTDTIPDDYVVTIKTLKFTNDNTSYYVGCARSALDSMDKSADPVRTIYMAVPMGVVFNMNLTSKIMKEV